MRRNIFLFILYLIIGLYVFNLGLSFINIPDKLVFLNKWFLMIGGVLVVLASFKWTKDQYGNV